MVERSQLTGRYGRGLVHRYPLSLQTLLILCGGHLRLATWRRIELPVSTQNTHFYPTEVIHQSKKVGVYVVKPQCIYGSYTFG